ncbi:hypothetical protein QSV34_07125 [Porticoccus sp. W117]|uniref:hypothetical protein n=1 Tax=Porticoccus sp. W117 TaxID=3054777 RepID=UPI0025997A2D|nr:hypothetical protein [Porticoccus sp. W117]MDM3871128.1 hypothetical protein [Porticoccus sp. W117]
MKTTLPLIAALLLASPAFADKVTEQIELGIEAYNDKDYQAAIDELQYAISQIQSKLDKDNAQLLPEPLEGWKAEDVEHNNAAMAMMGGGTHMSKRYRKGRESVEISISANSPMVTGLGAMINNPMLLRSDPNAEPFRYQRNKGIKRKERNSVEITLMLAGQILLQVKGQNLSDEAVLEEFLAAMDLKAIKLALLQ